MAEHDSPELEALFEAEATKAAGGLTGGSAIPNFKPEVAAGLTVRWKDAYADKLTIPQFKALADDTVAYLEELAAHIREENQLSGVDFF